MRTKYIRICYHYEYFYLFILTLLYILLIIFYTKGRLLIGGDWPGYYSIYEILVNPTPDGLPFALAFLITSNNIYFAFYLSLFISTFIILLSINYFIKSLFIDMINKKIIMAISILSCLAYLFNPTSFYDTFKSLIGNILLNNAGIFLFLAEVVNFCRSFLDNKYFKYRNAILMGIGIALSSMVPPNSFRIIILEIIIFIYAILITIIWLKLNKNEYNILQLVNKNTLKKIIIVLLTATIGMLYWILPFISEFEYNMHVALSAASVRYFSNNLFADLTPPYAELINVIRLLGVWTLFTDYFPYHNLYFFHPVIAVGSFVWPILALGLPLLVCGKKEQPIISAIILLILAGIFWDTAGNSPLGVVYMAVISEIPMLKALFPVYFISKTLLSKLYPVMVGYSIVMSYYWLRNKINKIRIGGKKVISQCVPLMVMGSLLIFLLISAWPVLSGDAMGQYFDRKIKGIQIPEEYFEAKKVLPDNVGVVLWPATNTYIRTSWGYQGTIYFYNKFFYPINIFTLNSLGGYTEYNPEAFHFYKSITIPRFVPRNIIYYNNTIITKNNIKIYNANILLNESYLYIYNFSINKNYIDVCFNLNHILDISNYKYIILKINVMPIQTVRQMISSENLWIGIGDNKGYVGWYIIDSSYNSGYKIYTNNSSFLIFLRVGHPDKPWPSSLYDPKRVKIIILRLYIHENSKINDLMLSIPKIGVANHDILDFSYIKLLKSNNFKYILLDKSIIEGAVSKDYLHYYNAVIKVLKNENKLLEIYNGNYLSIYKIR